MWEFGFQFNNFLVDYDQGLTKSLTFAVFRLLFSCLMCLSDCESAVQQPENGRTKGLCQSLIIIRLSQCPPQNQHLSREALFHAPGRNHVIGAYGAAAVPPELDQVAAAVRELWKVGWFTNQSLTVNYRVVQLNYSPEIEVYYMLLYAVLFLV